LRSEKVPPRSANLVTNLPITSRSESPTAGVTFVSATPSLGNCYGVATVTGSLGSINNGSNATVTLVLQSTATGVITNTATVSSTTTDPDPDSGNNDTGENTTVN
jgi:hypothetical protein